MLDIIWITNFIAISPAFTMDELPDLKKMGIDAIIDVRSEDTDDQGSIKQMGFEFFHIAVDDTYAPSYAQLESIVQFVNPLLDSNRKILIHCQNGYGRSPLVVLSILVKRGMSVVDAVSLLKKTHPFATFSPVQQKFLSSLKEF